MATLQMRKRTIANLEDAKKLDALITIIAVEIISEFGAAVFNHAVRDENAVQLVLPITLVSKPAPCSPRG